MDDADEGVLDWFGFSVAVAGDGGPGSIVVVGAPYSDGKEEGSSKGCVVAYELSEWNEWEPMGEKMWGDLGGDLFGWSVDVAVSQDGRIVVAGGAPGGGTDKAGYVKVYDWHDYSGGANVEWGWKKRGGRINGEFYDEKTGSSVSLSEDGVIVAVGTWKESGRVRVYYYDKAEEEFPKIESCFAEYEDCVHSSQCCDGLACFTRGATQTCQEDMFAGLGSQGSWKRVGYEAIQGTTVSLSADGTTMAVGDPWANGMGKVWNTYNTDSGAARVYKYQSEGSTIGWIQLGKDIVGENEYDFAGGSHEGSQLAISGDGGTIVLSSVKNIGDSTGDSGDENVGHARVFTYDSEGQNWKQVGLDMDGSNTGDYFGYSLSISRDGTMVAVAGAHDKPAKVFEISESCYLESMTPSETLQPTSTPLDQSILTTMFPTTYVTYDTSVSSMPTKYSTMETRIPTVQPVKSIDGEPDSFRNSSDFSSLGCLAAQTSYWIMAVMSVQIFCHFLFA